MANKKPCFQNGVELKTESHVTAACKPFRADIWVYRPLYLLMEKGEQMAEWAESYQSCFNLSS